MEQSQPETLPQPAPIDDQALWLDLTSGDDLRAEKAALALADLALEGEEKILKRLRGLLQAPEADRRWWALRSLAGIKSESVIDLLIRGLKDSDASVRQCAALGLRLHPHPIAVPALTEAFADADHLVVELAADALAQIGAPAVPALLDILSRGPQAKRLEAMRALATIGDSRAIPALFSALDEDSALMEYWASEGLERMGLGMVYFKP